MGYVKCAGYVWDMCGVRYANNLLKNPATKRLSGKKVDSCLAVRQEILLQWFHAQETAFAVEGQGETAYPSSMGGQTL